MIARETRALDKAMTPNAAITVETVSHSGLRALSTLPRDLGDAIGESIAPDEKAHDR